MTKNRRLVLLTVVILAVVMIAGAIGAALYSQTANGYSTQLARGQKYLEQNDFENAVLCYKRVIEQEPEQSEGYIGLAQAYIGLDKMTLAYNVLLEGYERTQSARMELMIQTWFETDDEDSSSETIVVESGERKLNVDLLDVIAFDTYADYQRDGELSQETAQDGAYTVTAGKIGAQLSFFNTEENRRVIDPNTGKPYSTCKPNTVVLDNVISLFGGGSAVTMEQIKDLKLSDVALTQEEATQKWFLTFTYEGCRAKIASDEEGNVRANAWNEFSPEPGRTPQPGETLTGRIVNAKTGDGVAGATLEFIPETGGESIVAQSQPGGSYSAALEPGRYRVKVSQAGFITEEFTVDVNPDGTLEDFTISPALEQGEIRIVLEWGAQPRDLDSYIRGETDDGKKVFTSYRSKVCQDGDNVLAELDVDDINGYGPETTTLYALDGVYEFVVQDFHATYTMAGSGATVKVYVGNETPIVINVAAEVENQWLVCRIDHGEVQVLNQRSPYGTTHVSGKA